jgi:hypothetical protein
MAVVAFFVLTEVESDDDIFTRKKTESKLYAVFGGVNRGSLDTFHRYQLLLQINFHIQGESIESEFNTAGDSCDDFCLSTFPTVVPIPYR